jgi:hypothetical protein
VRTCLPSYGFKKLLDFQFGVRLKYALAPLTGCTGHAKPKRLALRKKRENVQRNLVYSVAPASPAERFESGMLFLENEIEEAKS